jgi:RNA polymerase sigma factor (sigma-70 family)
MARDCPSGMKVPWNANDLTIAARTWTLDVTGKPAGSRTAPQQPFLEDGSVRTGVDRVQASARSSDRHSAEADSPNRDSVEWQAGGTIDWLTVTQGIRAGDPESVRVFYEAHFDRLLDRARHLTGRDEATCLDLVQTALLKAIRCLRPMADSNQLQRWLQVVLKTTAWDWLRQEHRRREEPARQLRAAAEPVDPAGDEPSAMECAARLVWIEEQLEQTEPELRGLLSLRYRLGWTLQQIARHCGLKTGAVDGRLRRAVQQFRDQAQRDFPDVARASRPLSSAIATPPTTPDSGQPNHDS